MPKVISIIDIDTTIANNDHRASLLQKECIQCLNKLGYEHRAACTVCASLDSRVTQSSWDAFLHPELLAKDVPVQAAQRVISHMRVLGLELHFVTGRIEGLRPVTEIWLKEHFQFDESRGETLVMRSVSMDGVSASKYKAHAVKEFVTSNPGSQFLFFEDDTHVFNTYSKLGLVIKCPEGWEYFHPEGAKGVEAAWKR